MLSLLEFVGLGFAALGCVCMAVRSLGEPDHRTTAYKGPTCEVCGWPKESILPCLCGARAAECSK